MVHDVASVRDLRAERRDLVTETLVDQAMALVEEGGLDALTLQRIARSLGYVTTAVYRYFPSKDALVAAMQRRAIAEIGAHFARELARREPQLARLAEPTRALAVLLALADAYLALPNAQPRAWHLIAVLLGDPRPLLSDEESRRTAPMLGALLAGIQGRFEHAVQVEALDRGPLAERTLAYWAALHGATCLDKLRRVAPQVPTSISVGRTAVRALLVSWGASSPRLSAATRVVWKEQ